MTEIEAIVETTETPDVAAPKARRRKDPETCKVRTSITLSPDVVEKLKSVAAVDARSNSGIIEDALRVHLGM